MLHCCNRSFILFTSFDDSGSKWRLTSSMIIDRLLLEDNVDRCCSNSLRKTSGDSMQIIWESYIGDQWTSLPLQRYRSKLIFILFVIVFQDRDCKQCLTSMSRLRRSGVKKKIHVKLGGVKFCIVSRRHFTVLITYLL